ncbi:MAG: TorF family putative porin [Methylococcaceae bacterium]
MHFSGMETSLKKTVFFNTLWGALFFYPCTNFADLHATLTGTTNNVGRWYTKSDNDFALQANIDYEHSSGFFIGNSVSNVNFGDNDFADAARVEITPYLGWSFGLSDNWRLDTQWTRYFYDGSIFGHSADYNEYYLFLHYKDIFSGRMSFSEDYYNLGGYILDYELTGRYPVTDKLEISGSFGYGQTKDALGSDYPYWNIGVSYFYKPVAFDLRYMDATETSIDAVIVETKHEQFDPKLIGASAVFSISIGF